MTVKENNLGELLKWLDETGWDSGLKILDKHLQRTEWLQADLYGNGDDKSIRQAGKLSQTIIKMQMTMMTLNRIKNGDIKRESLW